MLVNTWRRTLTLIIRLNEETSLKPFNEGFSKTVVLKTIFSYIIERYLRHERVKEIEKSYLFTVRSC